MADTTPYLLKYFQVEKPWDINMVHGVNDKERFVRYVSDPNVHMFEVDIEDYGEKVGDIILQHEKIGDVQLIWAIEQLIKHKKALKLDVKVPKGNSYRSEFYKYALDVMREHWNTDVPILDQCRRTKRTQLGELKSRSCRIGELYSIVQFLLQ